VRQNLLFIRPGATDEEMRTALRRAAALHLVSGPKGLDTVLGEGGTRLSGGEKQRLSIARALLREPQMLIFDEATAALDSITEESITATLTGIAAERRQMVISIAHRLSTIRHADRIYVLEKGRIAEQGTHEELLEKKGLYYALWRQQIGAREGRTNDYMST
jgi:ATP-binding cassette, subfamily B, bacterial